MATSTQIYKLGIFVLSGLVLLAMTLVLFAGGQWRREKVLAYSRFQESVQGLETGAPVKFRGVTIGRVTQILLQDSDLDVRVNMELYEDALQLKSQHSLRAFLGEIVANGARCRLELAGITGMKYVEINFFPVSTPASTTSVASDSKERFLIPSTPSLLAGLQSDLSYTLAKLAQVDFAQLGSDLQLLLAGMNRFLGDERLDAILAHLATTSARMDSLVQTLDTQLDHERLATTLAQIHDVLVGLETLVTTTTAQVAAFDSVALNTQSQALLGDLRAAVHGVGAAETSFQRTMEHVQALSNTAKAALQAADIEQTSADVRDALQALSSVGGAASGTATRFENLLEELTRLISTLEEDPGVLIYGRRNPPVQMGEE